MELYHLRAFLAVAELGNMTRAAERLLSSQPAVSGQIKALENELGVDLFVRGPGGVKLTAAGEHLIEHARSAIRGADLLRDAAKRLRDGEAGTLRIGLASVNSPAAIDDLTERLLRRRDVHLEFQHGPSGSVFQALVAGEVDAALCEGVFDEEGVHQQMVGQTHLRVLVPAAWASDLPAGDWSALARRPWVATSPECSYARELRRLSGRHGFEPTVQFRTDQDRSAALFVRQARAVSLVDRRIAEAAAVTGDAVLWKGYEGQIPIVAATLSARRAEPTLSRYLDACRRAFATKRDETLDARHDAAVIVSV